MTIQWTKPQEQKPEPNGAGRLDDFLIDEDRIRRRRFITNMHSLAATQKRLAADYRTWAAEGGSQAERYAREAQRLEDESKRHFERAAREQEELMQ